MNNPEQQVMPFGKYKDEKLGDIPLSYLDWCLDLKLEDWLKDAILRTVVILKRSGGKI